MQYNITVRAVYNVVGIQSQDYIEAAFYDVEEWSPGDSWLKDVPDVTSLFGTYCKVEATNSQISVVYKHHNKQHFLLKKITGQWVIADDSNGLKVQLKKFTNTEPEIENRNGIRWHRGNSNTFKFYDERQNKNKFWLRVQKNQSLATREECKKENETDNVDEKTITTDKKSETSQKQEDKDTILYICVSVVAVVLVIGLVLVVYLMQRNPKKRKSQKWRRMFTMVVMRITTMKMTIGLKTGMIIMNNLYALII